MSQFDTIMQGLEVDWVEVYDSQLLSQHKGTSVSRCWSL
jgi:hypothetical protein